MGRGQVWFTTPASPLIGGLFAPYNLAISGNTLYVSQDYSGSSWVGTYTTSGAVLNAKFITTTPVGAFGLAISGNHLFVSSGQDLGTGVAEYDATTGALVNANFITGIQYPVGLAVLGNTVANAGPSQTITATGTLVHLDGTQSYDLAGLAITYQWSFVSKPAGSNAALTGPNTSKPSFTADVLGDYSIQLVVTDSLGTASSPSTAPPSSRSAGKRRRAFAEWPIQ
jgi:hypothetical protein